MRKNRRDRTLCQARIHHQRHVGRRQIFAQRGVNRIRQTLATIFGRHRQPHPAALTILVVGFLEALRRRHRTVGVARAALLVAHAVKRMHDVFGKPCRLFEDRFEHIRAGIGKAGQVGIALVAKHIIENEQGVRDGRLVGRHEKSSKGRANLRRAGSFHGEARIGKHITNN